MMFKRRLAMLMLSVGALLLLASCGSASDVTTDTGAEPELTEEQAEEEQPEEDHDDEEDHDEHGDDDHDDEKDHDDEEDHDEHGDDEHDDHDDEDKDHDDHDEDDHDDHDDDSSGGLGAHEHGVAELSVALSGGDAVVDLISPAINIFGFEYEPETDEDKALAAERTDVLTSSGIVAFNDEAGCELAGDVEPEVEFEGSHAEVTTSWVFECANPGDIASLDLSELFSEFSGMLDVDAQWVTDDTQSAAELTPSSPVLRFE